jgi:hypothetical protein
VKENMERKTGTEASNEMNVTALQGSGSDGAILYCNRQNLVYASCIFNYLNVNQIN